MPAVRKHRWTLDEVERLMDERDGFTPRYELVDGELLVTPAPNGRHQRIVGQLHLLVHPYVVRNSLGEIRMGPGEVKLAPETRFERDVFVIPAVGGRRPRANDPVTRMLLAVEVLSPSSSRHDRITQRRFFQRHGVPEYWVVDGEAEAFEIWHPDDERAALVDDRFSWLPEGVVEPLIVDVRQFLDDVRDVDEPS